MSPRLLCAMPHTHTHIYTLNPFFYPPLRCPTMVNNPIRTSSVCINICFIMLKAKKLCKYFASDCTLEVNFFVNSMVLLHDTIYSNRNFRNVLIEKCAKTVS